MSLRSVLLSVIQEQPQTGYQLARQFDQVLGYFWRASHQQIYRELGKMTEDGLVDCHIVEQSSKPNKKTYSITAKGKEQAAQWLLDELKIKPVNDEVLARFYASRNEGVEASLRVLHEAKQAYGQRLEHFQRIEESCDEIIEPSPEDTVIKMILGLGIMRNKASLDWCEQCIDTLNKNRGN